MLPMNGSRTIPSVAPCVGAWIEILRVAMDTTDLGSLPAWERGLKCHQLRGLETQIASLPAWERGLKFIWLANDYKENHVAPCVGAWIEIQDVIIN